MCRSTRRRRQITTLPLRPSTASALSPTQQAPRRRGRQVPAAVKREVFARDDGCCSYTDERGERCCETRYLEFHHLQPFAHGGEHVATNLTLRCAAHNALAAEEDFGRDFIEHTRHMEIHESYASQRTSRARVGIEAARPPIVQRRSNGDAAPIAARMAEASVVDAGHVARASSCHRGAGASRG